MEKLRAMVWWLGLVVFVSAIVSASVFMASWSDSLSTILFWEPARLLIVRLARQFCAVSGIVAVLNMFLSIDNASAEGQHQSGLAIVAATVAMVMWLFFVIVFRPGSAL